MSRGQDVRGSEEAKTSFQTKVPQKTKKEMKHTKKDTS